ncbi:MAG TPA: hypothetical protein PLJ84_06265, partial [Bacteroidales bacterium]|nr:hypothetical protein [Bacteroidales bacterium]
PVYFLNPEGFGNLQGFHRRLLQHLISSFLFISIQRKPWHFASFSGLSWQEPVPFLNPEGFKNLQGFQPLAATASYFFLPFHLHPTETLALRFIFPGCRGKSLFIF